MRPGILLWVTSCIFLMKFIAFASGEDNGMLSTRHPCTLDMLKSNEKCVLDGFVGDKIDYEDDNVKIWSFNLEPGEMTSMHRHDHDYYFVVNNPSQLEVWGENGTRLFDFRAEGILGFRVQDDLLVPVNTELPFEVPRIHSAKNIGDQTYREILFELKNPDKVKMPVGNEL